MCIRDRLETDYSDKYYIAIEGTSPSVYIVQAADKGMTLMTGMPTEYYLSEGEELPMVFNHTDDSDIVFINTRLSGWAEITLGSLTRGEGDDHIYKETYSSVQRLSLIHIPSPRDS
eukprot:TRINITY_DN14886_c0_g1_i1.p1 TRINITY_DN14886_c0_g1~~TRINITY_DN14886_c0_g1_i1.p1  ORF type:complete len:116 (+),score=27.02 TRINITY_DN14886_c0_g1_i1:63-410(+)